MPYRYELHCHTKEVSRCGKVPAAEIVRLYKEKGYDGIVITDHYSPMTFSPATVACPQKAVGFYTSGYREALRNAGNDFTVLLGMELRYYATANDFLVYGVTEEFLKKSGNLMVKYPKRFFQLAKQNGYIVVQAHPFREGMFRVDSRWLDGAEVYNGKTKLEENEQAAGWVKENGMRVATSGSDFHRLPQLATGGILTETPIRSNEDLLRVLWNGDFERIETY